MMPIAGERHVGTWWMCAVAFLGMAAWVLAADVMTFPLRQRGHYFVFTGGLKALLALAPFLVGVLFVGLIASWWTNTSRVAYALMFGAMAVCGLAFVLAHPAA